MKKANEALPQLMRLIGILAESIHQSGTWITVQGIKTNLGVSDHTARLYFQHLQNIYGDRLELDIPSQGKGGRGQAKRLRLRDGLQGRLLAQAAKIHATDAISLKMIFDHFPQSTLDHLRQDTESLYNLLTSTEHSPSAAASARALYYSSKIGWDIPMETAGQNHTYFRHVDIQFELLEAIQSGQILEIEYQKRDGSSSLITAQGIIFFGKHNAFRLLVRKQHANTYQQLIPISILGLRALDEYAPIPDSAGIEYLIDAGIGLYLSDEATTTVRLEIAKPWAHLLSERRWAAKSKNQQHSVSPENPDLVILEFETQENDELVRWLLGWGSMIKVLSPQSLRQSLQSQAQKILEQYLE